METNSTLAIFLLAQASALSCARAFIMASMVGCAGAYTPPPQAAKLQSASSTEPSMPVRNKRVAPSTPTQKSTPVTTQLTEAPAPKPSAPIPQAVAQPAAQSATYSAQPAAVVTEQPAQESAAGAATTEPTQLQPEAALMHTEESITAPAISPASSASPASPAPPAPVVSHIRATSETATTTPVSREAGAFGRQNLVLERARNNPAEIVFIGDSITEGWEGAPEQWKMLIGSHSAINLGVGGDRTQHVLWRLEQAPLSAVNPKVVVVMIGTNNIYDDNCPDILAGIHDVVNLIHKQCPNAEVLVLDIPPRGDLKDSAREKIAQINIGLTLGMWPKHARFVRVGKQFLKPDGSIDPADMPDLLHFSQKGYAMWAASIKPELDCSLEANHPQPAPTMAHP